MAQAMKKSRNQVVADCLNHHQARKGETKDLEAASKSQMSFGAILIGSWLVYLVEKIMVRFLPGGDGNFQPDMKMLESGSGLLQQVLY